MQHFKTSLSLAVPALLATLAAPVSAETLKLVWDPNPEPGVVGYVLHVGSEPGVYKSRIDVGAATSHVLTTSAGQRYCFAVSAYVIGPIESARSSEVCTGGDLPPTVANPGAQSHSLGAPLSLSIAATDPEGAPMTFSATGLPEGLRIAAATGVISGTPTKPGTTTVRVKVTDGTSTVTQEFAWTIVTSVPQAPRLLRPSGVLATPKPVFEWQAVATATRYRLWVDDASPAKPRLQVDLKPEDAGCSAAGSTCRHASAVALAGTGSWSVRASNTAGDGPWSGAMDFTLSDGRAPSLSITSPATTATFSTRSATFALGGTATDDVGVAQVTWANDRGGSGTATGTSTWVVIGIPLKMGANVITVTARDAQKNTATKVLTVTRGDGDAPTVRIVAPTSAATFPTTTPTVVVSGTAADDGGVARVTWTNSLGGGGTASGTTNWRIEGLALKPGANQITVTATDPDGNAGRATLTVNARDTQRPTVAIASPAERRLVTAAGTLALSGSARDDFSVASVAWSNDRGGKGTAAGTTTWSIAGVPLRPGANVITVTATDAAGNTGTDVVTVLTDGQRPTVGIQRPVAAASHTTSAASIDLGGVADDDLGVTQVSWSNDRGGAGVAIGATAWSIPAVPLSSGRNVITVTARDAAGNIGTASLKVTRSDTAADANVTRQPSEPAAKPGKTPGAKTAKDAGPLAPAGNNTMADVVKALDIAQTSHALNLEARPSGAGTFAIHSPTPEAAWTTSSSTVALRGVASDNVERVTWTVDWGGSGTASGTGQWSIPTIGLRIGTNRIAVRAHDAGGVSQERVITVTYAPHTASR